MLSAKIVAQKPSGRVMPAASPLQLVAAAWAGGVADHNRIITPATRRLRGLDHRTIGRVDDKDDKYVHSIVHLHMVKAPESTPPKPWPQPLPQALRLRWRIGPRPPEVGFVLGYRQPPWRPPRSTLRERRLHRLILKVRCKHAPVSELDVLFGS